VKDLAFLDFLDEKIDLVEGKMLSGSERFHPDLKAALDHLLSSGGKRLRPKVALLVGSLLEADEEQLINLGAAIEMLHTATLVHDDLIDGALLRRGNPTLNSNWTPAATVLTGDFIFARAAFLAAEVGSPEVTSLFAETLSTIVNGEITQLFDRHQITEQETYYRWIYEKTGSMFVLAAKASAILGTADEGLIQAAQDYGREIGKAFQIIDDILDFTGETARVGKPVGNDLRQGVITLPALYFMDLHPQDNDLRAVLAGNITSQRIETLVGKIKHSGVIQRALKDAVQYSEQAVEHLRDFPPGRSRDALIQLSRYIVQRDL